MVGTFAAAAFSSRRAQFAGASDKTETPTETSVSSAHLGSPTKTVPVDELSLSLPPVLETMAFFKAVEGQQRDARKIIK
jgi:hypothetical protein